MPSFVSIYAMEQASSHPIAKSIRAYAEGALPPNFAPASAQNISETAGTGLTATGPDGAVYSLGAARRTTGAEAADIALTRDGLPVAYVTLHDALRATAATAVGDLHRAGIETVLLTGDSRRKANAVAGQLHIDRVYAEQLPGEKLDLISTLSSERSTAMVGDGINDSAALSRADVGVSLGGASAAALDAAQVVLLRDDLTLLTKGRDVAALTLKTIKESLFWAFSYNVVAIPLAALGFLNPMWAALFMAFSDVVVIGNAIRLKNRGV